MLSSSALASWNRLKVCLLAFQGAGECCGWPDVPLGPPVHFPHPLPGSPPIHLPQQSMMGSLLPHSNKRWGKQEGPGGAALSPGSAESSPTYPR